MRSYFYLSSKRSSPTRCCQTHLEPGDRKGSFETLCVTFQATKPLYCQKWSAYPETYYIITSLAKWKLTKLPQRRAYNGKIRSTWWKEMTCDLVNSSRWIVDSWKLLFPENHRVTEVTPSSGSLCLVYPRREYSQKSNNKWLLRKLLGIFLSFSPATAQHLPHQTNWRSSSRLSRRSLRASWRLCRRTSCGPWTTCFLFSYMWCYGPGDQSFWL